MNTREQTGGATAATDTNPAAVPADGYDTRTYARQAGRTASPTATTATTAGMTTARSCRTVMLSFREADFAARPPCYR